MMDFENLKKIIDEEMQQQNHRSISDFEGYSPNEMQHILYDPLGKESPVNLRKLPDELYAQMPLIAMIKEMAKMITAQGEIKLTAAGYLPVKMVTELLAKDYVQKALNLDIQDETRKEATAFPVHLTRIIMEICRMTKVRHNKLSMTASGIKLICGGDHQLFTQVFTIFTTYFNWGYGGFIDEQKIGRFGFAFSLILISRYGGEMRPPEFYAKKYFKAFPQLLEGLPVRYLPKTELGVIVYSRRVIHLFLKYFGLVTILKEERGSRSSLISKTPLFDALVKIYPHRRFTKN